MPPSYQLKNKFLRSHVARRIIALFLLSSLVPIIITAVLSMNYVSSLLIDNALQEMHKEGKLYAMSVNDRLLLIENKLKNIALLLITNKLSIEQLKTINNEEFSLLALLQTDGKTRYINTEVKQLPILPTLTATAKDNHKSQIAVNFSSADTAIIYMSIPLNLSSGKKPGHLLAKINSTFLWGSRESLPADKNICVLEDTKKILFCSTPIKNSVWKQINHKLDSVNTAPLEWKYDNDHYRAINWAFYLKTRFNSANWRILTSQQDSLVLQPIQTFNKIYALVILLTLLIVSLMSLSQIRRSLVPLERLIEGTRRVSNNEFTVPVEVHSQDEFEELADAFNSMTERLGLQINSLSILSEIDQLILSDPTSEKIITTVLNRIKDIVPSGMISITLMEHNKLEIGRTYFAEHDYPEKNQVEITSFLSEDIEIFLTKTDSGHLHLSSDSDTSFNTLNSYSTSSAYIFPVKIKGRIAALIYIGHKEKLELNDDDLNQIYELENRLAVALTAAEKDRKLYQQSHFDSLTRLPNRQLFNDRLDQEIIHSKRQDSLMALLFIDLDRFKNVNDTLGHFIGDQLLQLTANRLNSKVRETDTVARLGGDEFVIILSNINEAKDAGIFANNLINVLSEPFYIETNEIFVNASIGIAIYPVDGIDKTELLKNADTAMYRVKSRGRGHYMYFEEKMNHEDKERASLEQDLYHALENNEFELYYQPLVDLKKLKIIGAEALLRWNHPVRGIVPCVNFIPLAEETGLIADIGEWVIHTACAQYQSWKKQGVELERIAVNISGRQFLQHDFIDILLKALKAANMPVSCLELEMTESVLVDERIDILAMLNKLNDMGINLSIDDFGTGYSSFSYLKRFPVSTLKVDRSFMSGVPRDESANSIVGSIITMAHTLDIKVIAEGVETEEQYSLLKDHQCDYGQGYYFNPPLLAEQFFESVVNGAWLEE